MKTIGFFNIKGGVGKTTASINTAFQLSTHGKRVLVIDLDMQGNSSRFFEVYSKTAPSVSEVLLRQNEIESVIKQTKFTGIDVVPSNMRLIKTDKDIMLDTLYPQQTRLKAALEQVQANYDFCIIDCPTYLTLALINGLVAMDEIIVPTEIDEQAFEGLEYLLEVIKDIKAFNPTLTLAGVLVNSYRPNNQLHKEGLEWLEKFLPNKVFKQKIRFSDKAAEAIATRQPAMIYSSRSLVARNFRDSTKEILGVNNNGK